MEREIMIKSVLLIVIVGLLIGVGVMFYRFNNKNKIELKKEVLGKMEVKSVFNYGEEIPAKYTADGEDVNPRLEIVGIPEGAKTLVLIVDDPDAPIGTWTHWVVFNIPVEGERVVIEENSVPAGAKEGINDFKKLEYGGPAPPSGTHRYFFKVYALDNVLNLEEGVTREELERMMQGHILEKGELMGVYSRA